MEDLRSSQHIVDRPSVACISQLQTVAANLIEVQSCISRCTFIKQIVETWSNPVQLRTDIKVQAIQRYKAKLGNSSVGNGIFIAGTVCTKTYNTELL